MKTFYLQVREDQTITDAIEYEYGNYVPFEAETLPIGINGGWWKLIDGVLVEDVEKNPTTIENRINKAIDEYTLELLDGGIN